MKYEKEPSTFHASVKESHQKLAHWYLQLAQHIESGRTLPEGLILAEGPNKNARHRMAEQLRLGMSVPAMLAKEETWLPVADRAFIAAASESGKLAETFYSLHERHEQMQKTQIKIALALLYPLSLLHAGSFLFPLTKMISLETDFVWNGMSYFKQVGLLIALIWGTILLLTRLARMESPLFSRILLCIPVVRKYVKARAIADFSMSLGSLLEANTPIQTAWQWASKLSHDASIQKANQHLKTVFANGQNPSDVLDRFKCFPRDFKAFYKTGTSSGHLDDMLKRAGSQYQKEAYRHLIVATFLYPALLLLFVSGYIIYIVLRSYSTYFDLLGNFN